MGTESDAGEIVLTIALALISISFGYLCARILKQMMDESPKDENGEPSKQNQQKLNENQKQAQQPKVMENPYKQTWKEQLKLPVPFAVTIDLYIHVFILSIFIFSVEQWWAAILWVIGMCFIGGPLTCIWAIQAIWNKKILV